MSRYIDADMLIKKYIDTDIEKFNKSDVKIVLENLKQNILKAPSIEPCKDAIYREAVKEEICKPTWKMANKGELIAMINFIPSVAPSRPQGEWIDKGWHGDWQFETDGRGNCWKAFECSNCNTISKVQTNFCPNCGSEMKGADDE